VLIDRLTPKPPTAAVKVPLSATEPKPESAGEETEAPLVLDSLTLLG
jgi:hypothetical protein